jgi:peptide/nickel transport system permease protein
MTSNTPSLWQKFMQNKLACVGLLFILICVLITILGSLVRPDHTQNANDQHLILACQPPGKTVQLFQSLTSNEHEAEQSFGTNRPSIETIPFDSISIHSDSVYFYLQLDGAYTALSAAQSFASLGVPSTKMIEENSRRVTYWLGTDKYGRDVLSRLMAGTSISLAVGAIAVIISLLLGVVIGLLAGYFRGWVDAVLMWFTNVIWSIPTLLLVMAITFVFGTGFWKVFLAVGLTMWVEVARIARGQVLSIREKEYIEAARAMGFGHWRIMVKHILPNITSPIIVISAANFASAILIEAGLSFMGLGAQIPVPSWGNMIREHYSFITTDMAYLALAPGICIMLLVLSFMLVGNGLRDALDVRQ